MKKINRYSSTTIVVLLFIFHFGYMNIKNFFYNFNLESLENDIKVVDVKKYIKNIENMYNENFHKRNDFINNYGLIQKVMLKNEVDNFDVVRDKKGFLHYQYFADGPNSVDKIVNSTKKYKEFIEKIDVDFLVVLAPDKFLRGYTEFVGGLPYNYANETADIFLQKLRANNIDHLDLREGLLESGIPTDKIFFKTDHHWTPEAGFWAATRIVDKINENYDLNIDSNNYYINKENYNFKVYENFHLGSMGRRIGIYYSGIDDITIITPKFPTSFTHYYDGNNEEGRFEDVIIQKEWAMNVNIPIEERDAYSAYLGGNKAEAIIINNNIEDGANVMIIKDSFMLPTASILSTAVSELRLLDLRYYSEKTMYEYIIDYKPDLVIVSVTLTGLVEEFFNFSGDLQ